jgi:hypothetical protein
MWKFTPRLPTKYAWDNRDYQDQSTLENVFHALQSKSRYHRGKVCFHSDRLKYYEFSTVDQLRQIFGYLNNTELKDVFRIYLFNSGYFREG